MKIHYLDSYFMEGTHPITIGLIGCGGTGSNLLTQLGRINFSLQALGHPGLEVTVFDGDQVSEANPGRQLFSTNEIGLNKANALVTRINRFYGTQWTSVPGYYSADLPNGLKGHNLIVTCVDSASSRKEIYNVIKSHRGDTQPYSIYYWLDTGNTRDGGQIILGSLREIKQPEKSKFDCVSKLPHLLDRYPNIEEYDNEADQGPSCSVAQALAAQDLFVNSIIAQFTGDIIWKALKDGFVIHNGLFVNLTSRKTNPLKL